MTETERRNTLGKANYEGYIESSGGVSLKTGQKLPSWEEQDEKIRMAWIEGALHVEMKLNERT